MSEPADGQRRRARRGDEEARHAGRRGGARREPDGAAGHRRRRRATCRKVCAMRRHSGGRGAIVAELPGAVADATFAGSSRTNCATEMSAMRCRRSFSRHRRISVRTAAGTVGGQRGPVRLAAQHRRERVAHVLALERARPGEHLVEHAAERPHVTPLVRRAPLRLLRRHVRRRAEDHADAGHHRGDVIVGELRQVARRRARRIRCERFGQAEVQHLHLPVVREGDVRRLEVAVDDPLLVRGLQRIRDLARDRHRLPERQRSRLQSIGEGVALDEFEDEALRCRSTSSRP